MSQKKNIAVVMGGYSNESEVSLKSGQFILSNLDANLYHFYEVHILKEGWFLIDNNSKYTINKANFSCQIDDKKIQFDAVINTIHGTPGEDGHLQAYWELLGIPYTGCNFYLSALTFSKRDTLSVLSKYDIPMAQSIHSDSNNVLSFDEVVAKIGLPFFVKPNQSGSSLGVNKVSKAEDYDLALKNAFEQDHQIIIEQFMNGREFSVGVIKTKESTKAVAVTEIIPHNDFFDYKAKYLGQSTEVTPAEISDELRDNLMALTQKIYDLLNMTGIARLDFILHNNEPHFIEINTNPGLSPQSIFPQQAAHANISFTKLLNSEIEAAMNRPLIWQKL